MKHLMLIVSITISTLISNGCSNKSDPRADKILAMDESTLRESLSQFGACHGVFQALSEVTTGERHNNVLREALQNNKTMYVSATIRICPQINIDHLICRFDAAYVAIVGIEKSKQQALLTNELKKCNSQFGDILSKSSDKTFDDCVKETKNYLDMYVSPLVFKKFVDWKLTAERSLNFDSTKNKVEVYSYIGANHCPSNK